MKKMKQNRRVRKIKVDKQGKISIDWEVRPEGLSTWDEYHMKCSDLARPEFYNALVDLRQDVLTLLEYPKTWLDDILVKGVSFSYSDDSDDGVKGAVISGQRTLQYSASPANFNTPHKPYKMYNENAEDTDGIIVMPEEIQERLDVLDNEANKYIDGDRAQMELKFDDVRKPDKQEKSA